MFFAACGGDDFNGNGTGSGGAAGSGGASGSGGTAGGAGSAGTSGASGGAGTPTDGGAGSSSDGSAPAPLMVVHSSPLVESGAENSSTLTLTVAPHAGNAIIVGITCQDDFEVAGNGDCQLADGDVRDNQSNTYTRLVRSPPIQSSAQAARGYIFIAEGIGQPSGSFEITVDPGGPGSQQSWIVWGAIEVSGLAAASSMDAWDSTLVAQESPTMVGVTTTQANTIAVGVFSARSSDANMNIATEAAWTTHQVNQLGDGPPAHSMVSRIFANQGQVSHTWTHDTATRGATGILAAFKGATP